MCFALLVFFSFPGTLRVFRCLVKKKTLRIACLTLNFSDFLPKVRELVSIILGRSGKKSLKKY